MWLSKDVGRMAAAPVDVANPSGSPHWGTFAFATLWLLAFFVWFNSFPLPNNDIDRIQLWSVVPFDLLDLVDPLTEAGSTPWNWLNLLQRVPFFAIAVFVWTVAWSVGTLVLHVLRCDLPRCERTFFALCIGLSFLSLLTLLLGVCGFLSQALFWAVLAIVGAIGFVIDQRSHATRHLRQVPAPQLRQPFVESKYLGWIALSVIVLFAVGEMIGAMTPQIDFDVVAYHLDGPKEWFQQGRITRLPHNIYTNFPFLSEMLLLTGMSLYGDWDWGALAGQAISAGFIPLTALGLYAAGQRWFSRSVGWIAALVYVTSPWTYRISIIAYSEGTLSCYLFAALFAVLLFRDQILGAPTDLKVAPFPLAFVAGLMSGSAMACKYTGLTSVVIPCALLLTGIVARHVVVRRWSTLMSVGAAFMLGVLCCVGPWLVKNTVLTGNPVYPLAVRLFGGIDRTEELDLKWRNGHAAKSYASLGDRLADLPVKLIDVMAKNDWHGPLMFGLAILSLIWCLRYRRASDQNVSRSSGLISLFWLYVVWQFATWWLLTHQIDRFYVPMFSVVSLLAGLGACWCQSNDELFRRVKNVWLIPLGVFVAVSLCYNLTVMLHLGGFNAGRIDLLAARDIATPSRVRWLNEHYATGRLPKNSRVLGVGEVQLFHAQYPYVTNTVFDLSILEQLCADPHSSDHSLLPVDEIRANFQRLGITHLDVNWGWILTYREPGNYGYTDFVSPDRIMQLQAAGILGPAVHLPASIVEAELDPKRQKYLEEWGPSLIVRRKDKPRYIVGQIFPVLTGATTALSK